MEQKLFSLNCIQRFKSTSKVWIVKACKKYRILKVKKSLRHFGPKIELSSTNKTFSIFDSYVLKGGARKVAVFQSPYAYAHDPYNFNFWAKILYRLENSIQPFLKAFEEGFGWSRRIIRFLSWSFVHIWFYLVRSGSIDSSKLIKINRQNWTYINPWGLQSLFSLHFAFPNSIMYFAVT